MSGTITFDRLEALAAVKVLAKIASLTHKPALSYIYVSTTRDTVFLSASDLDTTARYQCKLASATDLIRTCVPAQPLLNYLLGSTSSRVDIVVHMVTLGEVPEGEGKEREEFRRLDFRGSDGFEVTDWAMDPDEYPCFPLGREEWLGEREKEEIASVVLPEGFGRDLRQVGGSASQDAVRWQLCGVWAASSLQSHGGGWEMCATDGKVLSLCHYRGEGEYSGLEFGVIIPNGACEVLSGVFEGSGEMWVDTVGRARVESCGWVVTFRGIEGTYPDYRLVLANPGVATRKRMSVKVLDGWLKQALSLWGRKKADRERSCVDLHYRFDGLAVEARNGESSVRFFENGGIHGPGHEDRKVLLNTLHLRRVLKGFPRGCDVDVMTYDPEHPVRLESPSTRVVTLCMPMIRG